ncbi:hypothetical protein [Streptosporangium longisporum]|uniref:DUF2637 domain-containing protein n=1 Tax=Streptosporangium longisporum TaxID=46187 RepID=A0ABP6L1I3_9ACTN
MQTVITLAGLVPPIWILIIALIVATVLGLGLWWLKRRLGRYTVEDILTVVAASIATGVSAQGMWRFSGDVLGFDGPLRLLLFAFIEIAVITSAVRARRSVQAKLPAGVDGVAVWVLTGLTAVLSSMDARSVAETIFRLAAPLVAAWLWERGMAIERHRLGQTRIHWRITPERILVWLGLAEATDRTAADVDAARRRTRIALAAKRARALRDAGASPKKIASAMRRMESRAAAAVRHIGLGVDAGQQRLLQQEVAALFSTAELVDVVPFSTWSPTPPARPKEADTIDRLAAGTRELTNTLVLREEILAARDEVRAARDETRAAEANILMVTKDRGAQPVIHPVNGKVIPLLGGTGGRAPANDPAPAAETTSGVTVRPVIAPVKVGVANMSAHALPWRPPTPHGMTILMTPPRPPGKVINPVNPSPPPPLPPADTKVGIMHAHWLAAVAQGEYPRVSELATAADADPAQASRYRAKWVKELPAWQQPLANARGAKDKASA